MTMRFVALAAAVLCVGIGSGGASAADTTPAPTATPINLPTVAPSSNLDPYAKTAIDILTGVVRQQITNYQNSTSGQVSYFKRFEMQVQTGRNAYRSIHLHQGTVINPRGQSIAIGQQVDVSGQTQADGSIDANTITIKQ